MAFLRFMVLGLLISSMVYLILWVRLRRRRADLLEEEWLEAGSEGDFDAFLREGHARYDRARHRTLLWLVYVLPLVTLMTIIYTRNIS